MDPQHTRLVPYDPEGIAAAAQLVRQGYPVAVPTETVYGLAVDATDGQAIARVYEAKGRPSFNPLIVHVLGLDQAERIARFDEAARSLAERFWPGPLTMVLPLLEGGPIAPLATAGLPTIALRAPAHPAMRALIEAVGRPLAAPSGNASGRISPTSAEHVLASLAQRIPMVVDGGATELGLESTIVSIAGGALRLLRPGPITLEELQQTGATVAAAERGAGIEAPGQMASHYAPSKPLRLEATCAEPDEWLIGFGPAGGHDSLSRSGDLREAAARVFAALHNADRQAEPRIAVAPVPEHGLGGAINDRLRRAAAPR